jgi:hypothetical protein
VGSHSGYSSCALRRGAAPSALLFPDCPQHITPRFSEAELAPALAPLTARLDALEAENEALRAKLSAKGD